MWKDAHILLTNALTSPLWGTTNRSGHQVEVSIWWAHHLTHSWESSKDGLGIKDQSDSFLPPPGDPVPDRNSWTYGSSSGGCLKSLGSSAQDCSWEPVASRFHLSRLVGGEVHFTLVSLEFLEVTHLVGLTRLGEAGPSSVKSPPGSPLVKPSAFCDPYTFCFWSALCFLTTGHFWSTGDCPNALSSSATHKRQRSSATLYVLPALPLWPAPGSELPSPPLGPSPGTLAVGPEVTKMFICHLHQGIEFCFSRCPSGSSSWLLWLGRTPPIPEVLP